MGERSVMFGRVWHWNGAYYSREHRRVPIEPPMYWAFVGDKPRHSPTGWCYDASPWGAIFKALTGQTPAAEVLDRPVTYRREVTR